MVLDDEAVKASGGISARVRERAFVDRRHTAARVIRGDLAAAGDAQRL